MHPCISVIDFRQNILQIHTNFLLQHYSLEDILNFYAKKYPNFSFFRALMSLTYFEDAEQQAMPEMFINVSWDTMKQHIVQVVHNYQPA